MMSIAIDSLYRAIDDSQQDAGSNMLAEKCLSFEVERKSHGADE
jgi:hypothetical protein